MVHVAHRLWADMRQRDPDYRILGLKADQPYLQLCVIGEGDNNCVL
jgi:hypothetical protein